MTREDRLYSMRMQDLKIVADKLGIKINTKAAKSIAVEKILAAENADTEKWEADANAEKAAKEQKQAENDKAAEDAVNKVKQPIEKNVAEPAEKPDRKRGALIEYKGKSQNICAWAKELGKSANTLYGRIYKLGWSVEDAFEK